MKKILTIAGSDCSGGAGIQADLKTFAAHGLFGMSVIVSVVAENTSRVIGIQDVTPEMIEQQIDAVFEDIEVDAVKIGMLSGSDCMRAVARKLRQYRPRISHLPGVVVDPVMYAKNGCPLMDPNAIDTLIQEILPLADVLTPNIPEAEKIAGMTISTLADREEYARRIHARRIHARRIHEMGGEGDGVLNVLVKGGHAAEGEEKENAIDILFDGENFFRFSAPRVDTKNTHGTGCTTSSAIASNLALGLSVREAVERAKAYVTTAIRHALPIGKGHGPTHHFYDLYRNGLGRNEEQE
jgi:hydroxymethylpyrimidine/phosphomethylpyrimidine kinase